MLLAEPVPGHQDHRRLEFERQDQTVVNRAAEALRLAAAALRNSRSVLVAYFRRLCSGMDKLKAVIDAAHKLAWLIYTFLIKNYTEQRSKLLRAALPQARAAGAVAAGGQTRYVDGLHRTTGLKISFQINHFERVSRNISAESLFVYRNAFFASTTTNSEIHIAPIKASTVVNIRSQGLAASYVTSPNPRVANVVSDK